MRYVINVTLNGDRFFSTNRAAALTADNIGSVVAGMKAGFPAEAGYQVEAFRIETGMNKAMKIEQPSADQLGAVDNTED